MTIEFCDKKKFGMSGNKVVDQHGLDSYSQAHLQARRYKSSWVSKKAT